MNRDDFKKFAAGHYALLNGGKIDEGLATFVEGAMIAYDFLKKTKKEKETIEVIQEPQRIEALDSL